MIKKFIIITDYKNLEYFINPRKLNKRQVRWSIFLSQYNIKMVYQSGKKNQKIDVLSQKEQDILLNNNIRIIKRKFQLLKLNHSEPNKKKRIGINYNY